MEVFRAVADLGSFARAADQLDLSRASVTTHVAQLESYLGVRLINRTTRRLALTDDGVAYLEHCRRILADVAETVATLQRGRTVPRGRLRVDMMSALGRHIVVPALPRFLDQYPELEVTMTFNDQIIDLVAAGIDVSLRVGELPDSTIVARRVHDMGFAVVASPDYIEAFGEPAAPAELTNHRTLAFFNPSTSRIAEWPFEKGGERFNFMPDARLAISDAESLVQLAIDGKGILYFADMLVRPAIASGELRLILADWTPAVRLPISIVYPQNRHLSAKVRAFADFVAGLFPKRAPTLRG